jgi:pSer/pThr/pTyr-binding forkhead associated (FHA) protein
MGELCILNGPDKGLCFDLNEGVNFIGRSRENNVQIHDETVSRRHLQIVKKSGRYFLTDLGSQNGTFLNGAYLTPGIEVEARGGAPIGIGMTVIGIGGESCHSMLSLVDSIGLTRDSNDKSGIFAVHKGKTNQRKLELIYRVTDLLQLNLPKEDLLEMLLDVFLELLVRIDRAVFVLIDRETGKIARSISKSKRAKGKTIFTYSEEVVHRVLKEKKSLTIADAQNEAREAELASTLKMESISSVMCVPMMSSSEIVGVIYVDSLEKPYPFAPEDILFFEDIAQRTAAYVLLKDLTPG